MTYVIKAEIDHNMFRWLRGWDKDKPVLVRWKETNEGRQLQEYTDMVRAIKEATKVNNYLESNGLKFRRVRIVEWR